MEVQVARSTFAEEIGWTSKVIPQRPTNPILNGLLLRAQDSELHLSATDQSAASHTTLDANVLTPGEAVIPGKLVSQIASQLPQQPVVGGEGGEEGGAVVGVEGVRGHAGFERGDLREEDGGFGLLHFEVFHDVETGEGIIIGITASAIPLPSSKTATHAIKSKLP